MASVPQAIASIDGTFLDANNTFCTLTGYSREEILRKSFFNLTPPQELQATFSVVSELMGKQTCGGGYATRSFKKMCRMRYGVVEVFVSMSVIKHSDDSPAYFTCAVLPVTGSGDEQAAAVGSLAHHSNSSAASTRSGASGEDSEYSPSQGGPRPAKMSAKRESPPIPSPPAAMRSFITPVHGTAAGGPVCSPGDGACPSMLASAVQHMHSSQAAHPHSAASGASHPAAAQSRQPSAVAPASLRMPSIASVDTEAVLAGMQHSSERFGKAHAAQQEQQQPLHIRSPPAGIPMVPPGVFVAPVGNGGVTGNNSIAAFSLGMQDDDWREQDGFLADMTFDN